LIFDILDYSSRCYSFLVNGDFSICRRRSFLPVRRCNLTIITTLDLARGGPEVDHVLAHLLALLVPLLGDGGLLLQDFG